METCECMENFQAQTKNFYMCMEHLKVHICKKSHTFVYDIYDYFLQCSFEKVIYHVLYLNFVLITNAKLEKSDNLDYYVYLLFTTDHYNFRYMQISITLPNLLLQNIKTRATYFPLIKTPHI